MTALQSYGGIAICLLHRRISLPYAMTQYIYIYIFIYIYIYTRIHVCNQV